MRMLPTALMIPERSRFAFQTSPVTRKGICTCTCDQSLPVNREISVFIVFGKNNQKRVENEYCRADVSLRVYDCRFLLWNGGGRHRSCPPRTLNSRSVVIADQY